MGNKKFKESFKRGRLGYRILITTFIYLFLLVAELSPFILIKDSNKVLAIILVSITTVAYIFIILVYIWDVIKEKDRDSNK